MKGRHTTIVSDAKVKGPLYHHRIIDCLARSTFVFALNQWNLNVMEFSESCRMTRVDCSPSFSVLLGILNARDYRALLTGNGSYIMQCSLLSMLLKSLSV